MAQRQNPMRRATIVRLSGDPGTWCRAELLARDKNSRPVKCSGEGDDWAEAIAMAARELLDAKRAGIVVMTPAAAKRVAAVSFLDNKQIAPAIAAGAQVLQQARDQAKTAAIAAGTNVAKSVAGAVEDAAGPALQAVLSTLPLGGVAYQAGVQVWRQVKKIPFLGRLFG